MDTFDNRTIFNKTSDTDVKYTGAPVAGVKPGDSLKKVLDMLLPVIIEIGKIQERVAALEQLASGISAGNVLAGSSLYDLVNQAGAVEASVGTSPIVLNVKDGSTNNTSEITFDLKPSLANLDSSYTVIGSSVNVKSANAPVRLLASSSSKTGVLVIDKQSSPIVVTAKVNLKSQDDEVVLTKIFYLQNTNPVELTGKFTADSLSSAEAKSYTQKDYNETLASNVSKLAKSVQALNDQIDTLKAASVS